MKKILKLQKMKTASKKQISLYQADLAYPVYKLVPLNSFVIQKYSN